MTAFIYIVAFETKIELIVHYNNDNGDETYDNDINDDDNDDDDDDNSIDYDDSNCDDDNNESKKLQYDDYIITLQLKHFCLL